MRRGDAVCGRCVPIEIEVSVDAFDAPKSLDQEARAYTGAKIPITVKDGNNKVVNGALKPNNSSSVGTLKPLGSLLLVTFRNNMMEDVTFNGINVVSNSFFGPNNQNKQAVYDIATGAFSNTVSYQSPYAKSTEAGAGYTFFYKDFSSGSSSLPGGGGISIASGASADKALVFWGFHTGGSAKVSASNKLKAVTGASMEADILTPSTSLLHVYGHNVKVGTLTPSRPNYSIAPIGGANLTPEMDRPKSRGVEPAHLVELMVCESLSVSAASIAFATQDTYVCVGSEPSSCVCRAGVVIQLYTSQAAYE